MDTPVYYSLKLGGDAPPPQCSSWGRRPLPPDIIPYLSEISSEADLSDVGEERQKLQNIRVIVRITLIRPTTLYKRNLEQEPQASYIIAVTWNIAL